MRGVSDEPISALNIIISDSGRTNYRIAELRVLTVSEFDGKSYSSSFLQ